MKRKFKQVIMTSKLKKLMKDIDKTSLVYKLKEFAKSIDYTNLANVVFKSNQGQHPIPL